MLVKNSRTKEIMDVEYDEMTKRKIEEGEYLILEHGTVKLGDVDGKKPNNLDG